MHYTFGVKKHTVHWLELARYDLKTAEHMLKSRRYIYVVFLSHLTIEKLLEAYITETTTDFPPYIHDLNKLTEKAGLAFPTSLAGLVDQMSKASVPTRYPEDLKAIKRRTAEECFEQTRKVFKWLERQLKSVA